MTGQTLYVADAFAALAFLVLFIFMRGRGRAGGERWRMFLAGSCIGATWEIGFYFLGPRFSSAPLYVFRTDPPFPPIILHILHCFWDGALFMVGVALVHRLLKPPHFAAFRWSELGVLLGWGVAQEAVVELVSLGGSLWAYQARWYNPSLFEVKGEPFTLLPLVVWVVAPLAFYLLALRVARK